MRDVVPFLNVTRPDATPGPDQAEAPAALWTVKDVAAFLQVSPRSVWRYAEEGKLPRPVKLGRNACRWFPAEVRAAVEALRSRQ